MGAGILLGTVSISTENLAQASGKKKPERVPTTSGPAREYVRKHRRDYERAENEYRRGVSAVSGELDDVYGETIQARGTLRTKKAELERLRKKKTGGFLGIGKSYKSAADKARDARLARQVRTIDAKLGRLRDRKRELDRDRSRYQGQARNAVKGADDAALSAEYRLGKLENDILDAKVTAKLAVVAGSLTDLRVARQSLEAIYDQGLIGEYIRLKFDKFLSSARFHGRIKEILCSTDLDSCSTILNLKRSVDSIKKKLRSQSRKAGKPAGKAGAEEAY